IQSFVESGWPAYRVLLDARLCHRGFQHLRHGCGHEDLYTADAQRRPERESELGTRWRAYRFYVDAHRVAADLVHACEWYAGQAVDHAGQQLDARLGQI